MIQTIYILSLEDNILEENHIQRIDLPIFRGNFLMGNNSRDNIGIRSLQKIIREEVHSHFLILGNYYNREREIEETKILIDMGASYNHIQVDKCKMIESITSPYIFKNFDCDVPNSAPSVRQG